MRALLPSNLVRLHYFIKRSMNSSSGARVLSSRWQLSNQKRTSPKKGAHTHVRRKKWVRKIRPVEDLRLQLIAEIKASKRNCPLCAVRHPSGPITHDVDACRVQIDYIRCGATMGLFGARRACHLCYEAGKAEKGCPLGYHMTPS